MFEPEPKQIFRYTRRISPKSVTSLPCPSPRHSANATAATCADVELAIANRLECCVRFDRPRIRTLELTPVHNVRRLIVRPSRRYFGKIKQKL